MRALLVFLLVTCAAMPEALHARACRAGLVFEDRDGDGQQGEGEPGLAGIAVSDGQRIVRTDTLGRWKLPLAHGPSVFVIKPPSHGLPTGADGLPAFWRPLPRRGDESAPDVDCAAFALRPRAAPAPEPLKVLLMGDPQPKTLVDVVYYERDIVAPLVVAADGNPVADLGLTLGDVVSDDASLYPRMIELTARLRTPWLHAAGNHDLDFQAMGDVRSLDSFHRHFGPDTFAWEEPQASFIVLDDVIYQPRAGKPYIGGLRREQFFFLEAYLATVPRDRRLVLVAHIPFFDEPGRETFRQSDRERLFAMLEPFENVLLLTAHGHVQRHYRHGPADGWHGSEPLHEYNVGAACGGYWSGEKDADGIPDARMSDGTPNGYARAEFRSDGSYGLFWQVARGGDAAMHLHAPRVLRTGSYPAAGVYANVYMGEADTRVEFRINQGPWRPMARTDEPDPALRRENLLDDATSILRGYDRLPEAEATTHLWRATLPTDLGDGDHAVEVRAFDRWRGEVRASTTYRLVDASP
ncbi:calcineurin-like phosphoesterase C-terminal domain-containing protein [Arenimonas donghaensis]|uniref:Uncharacterized protein n=1 Tax=Arenimonas donghaensis DSM 18148 = HO3-R19 TaxID=1121014 RepID=A0A087MLB5_9GAMM|nr:calcineurin-like phosphoesterase family protein [Arenimonas donghaensis]KFL37668.1 hypothetical protein N788_00435 [Arenimonas donghaensis DSM 18148 = HO3-R19]